MQKWPKIKYGKILKSDLQDMWQEIQFEVLSPPGKVEINANFGLIPLMCTLNTALPFWIKRIPENVSSFPGIHHRQKGKKINIARF